MRQAVRMAEGLVTVSVINGPETLFSEHLACVECGINVPTLEPRSFSFNSRFGACPVCQGLGFALQVNLERLIVNPDAGLDELKLGLGDRGLRHLFRESAGALLTHFRIARKTPYRKYPKRMIRALLEGLEEPIRFSL